MKSLIRMRHLQARNSLSEAEVAEKSKKVMEKLFGLPEFENSKAVLFYASFGNEVATTKMIEKALELGKKVCVPVTSFKEKTIAVSEIESVDELEKKESGLVEPREVRECSINEMGMVIVPGIVFDEDGNRIGYGGGFYDRLLNKAPRGIVAVGLCFEQNIEKRITGQSHDVRMELVVTEERVIDCRQSEA